MLSTQSDERLVDLVRAGSDPAFETIVERYRRALMRYVSRILPAERAEDVVQQSFVKAYEAIRRSEAEIVLRPWLYRIAHNNALNALRDRGFHHAELDERLDRVERPDQALERVTGLRELVVAVQALPERQRDAILLRELEGRSYGEIAAALGVTDGAVRQLLNRARNTLRAAAAALTPAPLLTRVAGIESAEPVAARVAELAGAGAGGAVVAKVCATVLVTGAVVGGAAVVPRGDEPPAGVGADSAQAAEEGSGDGGGEGGAGSDDGGLPAGGDVQLSGDGTGSRDGGAGGRSGRDGGDEGGRSGPGGGELDSSGPGGGDGDSSGPGGGDNSGPGGGGGDNSGPGGGGGDNSGPGGGSIDSSGPGSENSGPGSGSGGGSGSSGSGSGGSAGSGSGTDGSASGTSGSGTDADLSGT